MTQSNADKIHYVRIPKGQGGRAEMARLVYVLAGKAYVDVLHTFGEAAQAVAGKNPFKQFPFVETPTGAVIYQTLAIMHHASHGTPVWPSDPDKLTQTLAVAMGGYDLYQAFGAFAAGDSPTFADAIVHEAVAWVVRRNDVCRGLLETNKALAAFQDRFQSIPAVREFMQRQAAARQADDSV